MWKGPVRVPVVTVGPILTMGDYVDNVRPRGVFCQDRTYFAKVGLIWKWKEDLDK